MWGPALLLLVLYLAPGWSASACLTRGEACRGARRDAIQPASLPIPRGVIQVFAAPAVSWRGIFSCPYLGCGKTDRRAPLYSL